MSISARCAAENIMSEGLFQEIVFGLILHKDARRLNKCAFIDPR